MGTFFEKKYHNFHHSLFELVFSVLQPNEALYNFHKRGQGLRAGYCFSVGLMTFSILCLLKV